MDGRRDRLMSGRLCVFFYSAADELRRGEWWDEWLRKGRERKGKETPSGLLLGLVWSGLVWPGGVAWGCFVIQKSAAVQCMVVSCSLVQYSVQSSPVQSRSCHSPIQSRTLNTRKAAKADVLLREYTVREVTVTRGTRHSQCHGIMSTRHTICHTICHLIECGK